MRIVAGILIVAGLSLGYATAGKGDIGCDLNELAFRAGISVLMIMMAGGIIIITEKG